MKEAVRLYRYRQLLSTRRAMSARDLQAGLEISPATFKRDLQLLRDDRHVPIRHDPDSGGYGMKRGVNV